MLKEKTFIFFWLCFCHLVGVLGESVAVKSVSVMKGESVSLQINVIEIQKDDEIQWRFGTNGALIAKTNGVTNTILDGTDGRFRDRLKLDHQTGSLTITNTRTTDSGLYEAEISRSSSEDIHSFNVTVYAPTTPDLHSTSHPTSGPLSSAHLSPPSGPHSGSPSGPPSGFPAGNPTNPPSGSPNFLIVLISAAAAAGSLLLVVAVGIFCICKKQRKTDQHVETREEEITYADPTFYKRNAQKSSATQEDDVVYASVVHRR